jgi:NADH-quinone oxidoreductase subunit L
MLDILIIIIYYFFVIILFFYLKMLVYKYCATIIVSILLLHLVSFFIEIFFGRYLNVRVSPFFAVISCLLSMLLFCNLLNTGLGYESILRYAVNMGSLRISFFFYYDCLTPMFLFIVTFLSASLHIDLIDYMEQDPYVSRFLPFLSLFIFFMLILGIANNFSEVSVSWKG